MRFTSLMNGCNFSDETPLLSKCASRDRQMAAIFRIRVRASQNGVLEPSPVKMRFTSSTNGCNFSDQGSSESKWCPGWLSSFFRRVWKEGRVRSVLIRSLTGMILFFSFQDEDTGGGGVCRWRWSVPVAGRCVCCVCVSCRMAGMGSSMTEDGEWDPA